MAVEADESKDISISLGISWLGYWCRISGGGCCCFMDSIFDVACTMLLWYLFSNWGAVICDVLTRCVYRLKLSSLDTMAAAAFVSQNLTVKYPICCWGIQLFVQMPLLRSFYQEERLYMSR